MVQRVHPTEEISDEKGLEKVNDDENDQCIKLNKLDTLSELGDVDDAVSDVDEAEAGQKEALSRIKSLVREMKNDSEMQSKQRRRACLHMSAWHEEKKTREKHGHESWQSRMLHILHHHVFQSILIAALLIDVKIVIIELFLEAQYPHCEIVTRDSISCVPKAWVPNHRRVTGLYGGEKRHGAVSWLAEESSSLMSRDPRGRNLGDAGDGHGAPTCPDANNVLLESAKTSCDKHKYPWLHRVHGVLWLTSVFILSMFLIELFCLMLCLWCDFFKNPLYVGDFIIVAGSLVLEFIIKTHNQQSLMSLLLFVRFWRFVRVAHGIITSIHEPMHHKLEHVEASCSELSKHVDNLTAAKNKLEVTVKNLTKELGNSGLKVPEDLRQAAMSASDFASDLMPFAAKDN